MLLVREIVTPKRSSFTVKIPKSMIGKTVEVIAFEINDTLVQVDKEQRLNEIEELTKGTLVNLSNFKFDRNEANDYQE